MRHLSSLLVLLSLLFLACKSSQPTATSTSSNTNPAAAGFNETASDQRAIAIADEVMLAMGGRSNWDATRYISWNFFGSRRLLWDKHTGDVRIESMKDNFKVLLNINSMKGQVMMNDELVTHPDSLSKYLERGKNIWINDSYWLVMPFKLKDSGVTLKYSAAVGNADVLQLTFEGVGKTPQNKYLVHVDKTSKLVTEWVFFGKSDDEKPRFSTPWEDYKPHGKILLSSSRGEKYKLDDVRVYEEVPAHAFSSFEAIDWLREGIEGTK